MCENNFMQFDKKRIFSIILVFTLWLALLLNNYIWLQIDHNPFTYDAHRHFMLSLRVFKAYHHLSPNIFSEIISLTQRHPPLVAMVTAPFYFFFGITQDAGTMLNAAIFSAILIFSVYLIGVKVFGYGVGLLSAFITAMYPIIFNHLKTYNLDLPLTAMVALCVCFLILSKNFISLRYSLLFGISCCFGFLTKDSFPIYLITPAAVAIFNRLNLNKHSPASESIREAGILPDIKKHAVRLIIFLTIFFAALVYVMHKWEFILGKLHFGEYWTFYLPPGALPNWPSVFVLLFKMIKSLLWYLWGFLNWQVSFLSIIIFIITLFFIKKTPSKIKAKSILFSSLTGFLFIAFSKGAYGEHMKWMGVRFTMPILPFVAIISAAGILSIPARVIRRGLVTTMIVLGAIQFFAISYGSPLLPKEIIIPLKKHLPKRINKYYLFPQEIIIFKQKWPAYGGPMSLPNNEIPVKIEIPEEIFKAIDSSNSQGRPINILVIPDISRIWARLEYASFVKNKPYTVFGDWAYFFINRPVGKKGGPPSGEFIFTDVDYVIDKYEGELGEYYRENTVMILHNKFKENYIGKFELIKAFKWPDGSNIHLYKRKGAFYPHGF